MQLKIALQPKQSDVEAFQAGLLMLAKDLITNKSIKIRMFAWKELMKYSFSKKSNITGDLQHQHQHIHKVYVSPAFSDDNVDSKESQISK